MSLLLFLILLSLCLRLLQSGGRGYRYVCLSLHADHNISASAYAYDIVATVDLARQAEKIEVFVNWSMAVSVKKCAVTGILWGQAYRNGSDKVN